MLHAGNDLPNSVSFRLMNLDAGHCPDWVKESPSCVPGVALKRGVERGNAHHEDSQPKM